MPEPENKKNLPANLKKLIGVKEDLPIKQDAKDAEYFSNSDYSSLEGTPIKYHLIWISSLAFIIVGAIWANFAVLDVVTVGQGKVISSSNMQVVQNLEGGIVKEIKVKVGDEVLADQVLMVIDDTRFTSMLKESETQIYALQAKIIRLTAEATDSELKFPQELEEHYPQYVNSERNLYDSRRNQIQVKLNILIDSEKQSQQELSGAKGKKEQLLRSLELVKKELSLTKPLVGQGAVSEVELLRIERTANDMQGELDQTIANISKLEAALAGAKKKIEELSLADKSDVYTELNKAKTEYNKFDESIKAAADRVKRTLVRSPVHGLINQVKVATIGGIVQPGQDLITIVPIDDNLVIEAKVKPADIGFLRPGLPATVKVSAYDFSIYGGLKAVVEHISADTIEDEKKNPFYQIRVRTTKRNYLVGRHGEKLQIIPGMSCTVDILTGHKTVLQYLLSPILKAKESAMRER